MFFCKPPCCCGAIIIIGSRCDAGSSLWKYTTGNPNPLPTTGKIYDADGKCWSVVVSSGDTTGLTEWAPAAGPFDTCDECTIGCVETTDPVNGSLQWNLSAFGPTLPVVDKWYTILVDGVPTCVKVVSAARGSPCPEFPGAEGTWMPTAGPFDDDTCNAYPYTLTPCGGGTPIYLHSLDGIAPESEILLASDGLHYVVSDGGTPTGPMGAYTYEACP